MSQVAQDFLDFSTENPSSQEPPQSWANQGCWSHNCIAASSWKVEWLQCHQKGYAKSYHVPDGAGAWGCGEVRVAGQPGPRHVGRSIEGHCWFPQGKPAMPGWAYTHLGMEDGGGRLPRTVARLFPPRNRSAWSWPKPSERKTRKLQATGEGKLYADGQDHVLPPDPAALARPLPSPRPWRSPQPPRASGEALELSANTSWLLGLRSLLQVSVQVQPESIGMGGPEYLGENFLSIQNHVELLRDWNTGLMLSFLSEKDFTICGRLC